jgi:hypothetical protein
MWLESEESCMKKKLWLLLIIIIAFPCRLICSDVPKEVKDLVCAYVKAEFDGDSEMRVENGYFGKLDYPKGDDHPGRFDVGYDAIDVIKSYDIIGFKKNKTIWEAQVRSYILAKIRKFGSKIKLTKDGKSCIYNIKVKKNTGRWYVVQPESPKVNIAIVISRYKEKIASLEEHVGKVVLDQEVSKKFPRGLLYHRLKDELKEIENL